MIAIVRITGRVKTKEKVTETLVRLGLGKKYTCILIDEKDKIKNGMLKKVKDYVAYGEIDKQLIIRLVEKRGQSLNKKPIKDAEKIADAILSGKNPEELGIKKYFRLHPPLGGLKSSKKQFPKGVLGNHKQEINKLIERML